MTRRILFDRNAQLSFADLELEGHYAAREKNPDYVVRMLGRISDEAVGRAFWIVRDAFACVAPVFSRPNSPNLSLVGRWPPIWPSLAAVPSKRWLGLVAKPFWSAGLPFHWAPAARPVAERSEPNGRGAPGPSRQWLPFGLAPAAGGGGFGSYAKVMAGSSRDRGIPKPPWRRGYAAKALDETGSTADPVAGRVVGRGRAPSRATRR